MLGYTDENDFPNFLSSFVKAIHPDHVQYEVGCFINHMFDKTGQTPFNIESRMRKKNGEEIYFNTFGATVRDHEGNPLRMVGALLDITEDKKHLDMLKQREIDMENLLATVKESEQASKEKNHWYESLLDAFYESQMTATDMNKKITFLNNAALKTLGKTREETIGKYCGDVWNVDICKDNRCGIECLKRGEGKSLFHVGDKTFTSFVSYIKDLSGKDIGHIEVISNISDAMNREQEITKLNTMLEKEKKKKK